MAILCLINFVQFNCLVGIVHHYYLHQRSCDLGGAVDCGALQASQGSAASLLKDRLGILFSPCEVVHKLLPMEDASLKFCS